MEDIDKKFDRVEKKVDRITKLILKIIGSIVVVGGAIFIGVKQLVNEEKDVENAIKELHEKLDKHLPDSNKIVNEDIKKLGIQLDSNGNAHLYESHISSKLVENDSLLTKYTLLGDTGIIQIRICNTSLFHGAHLIKQLEVIHHDTVMYSSLKDSLSQEEILVYKNDTLASSCNDTLIIPATSSKKESAIMDTIQSQSVIDSLQPNPDTRRLDSNVNPVDTNAISQ